VSGSTGEYLPAPAGAAVVGPAPAGAAFAGAAPVTVGWAVSPGPATRNRRAVTSRPGAFAGRWRAAGRLPGAGPAVRPADSLAEHWPLADYLELGPLPGCVPCARYHTRQILWEWRLTRLSEAAELVVTELVTNAVSASRGLDWPAPVRLWLLSDRARVLIVIWDASPDPPILTAAAGDSASGRGLLLVDAVSARWDWHSVADPAGKVIRALITE
jgi:anti-sigma regulatory factor (Ser/Thr protein kinase)